MEMAAPRAEPHTGDVWRLLERRGRPSPSARASDPPTRSPPPPRPGICVGLLHSTRPLQKGRAAAFCYLEKT